jgi:neurobeachin-like protein 1/2
MQDWLSESIDLSDAASFRDLSKPIGAIDEERLERFQERYASLQGDDSVAPFFYGTHYSSAGIVLWYLLRMAPFTALAHSLQVPPLLSIACYASLLC